MAFITPTFFRTSHSPCLRSPRQPPTATAAKPASIPSSEPPFDLPQDEESPAPDPIQTTLDKLEKSVNTSYDALFQTIAPLFPPLSRPWSLSSRNFILHPPGQPKAVLHFLGGAFFAAAPHILYHTFLTRLAAKGYVIVATPYELSFEYLPVAERICDAWEAVESDLAAQYGELPVIGVGHSSGAMFHALITCLFSDCISKAGNIFISFSNRKASKAIPMFETLIAPAAKGLVNVRNGLPDTVKAVFEDIPVQMDKLLDDIPLAPEKYRESVLPTFREARKFLEQLPALFEEIGTGSKEFYPTPEDIGASVQKLYAVEQTLVVTFANDALDDSQDLIDALKKGKNDISMVELAGSHLTPLSQQSDVEGVGGIVGDFVMNLQEMDRLIKVIEDWVQAGLSNDKL